MSDISSVIFRAYDIRGIVDQDLTEEGAYLIGRAIGSEIITQGQKKLFIARDCRLTGERLIEKISQGLLDSGCNVVDLGVTTTPALYFACKQHAEINSGVMLTASHNPPNYNGMKIVINDQAIFGDKIVELQQRIKDDNFTNGHGKKEYFTDINQQYLDIVYDKISLAKPLKIVIDCANSVAGLIAPQLFNRLGCEVIELYCDIDGRFPNHQPDPSQIENLEDLIKAVKYHHADIGLAFDGDADRLYSINETGKIIFPDRMLMLIAKDILQRNPGATIIYDVKSSRYLPQVIQEHKGKPIMCKTGHAFIKQEMINTNALLAGEMSGHVFIAEHWFGFDDGIFTAARLLEILSKDKRSYSDIMNSLPEGFSTKELMLSVNEQDKEAIMEKVAQLNFGDADIIRIDGIRVEFSNGWGLVRQSNTSPNLILRFEADSENSLAKIQEIFREKLLSINSSWKLPF